MKKTREKIKIKSHESLEAVHTHTHTHTDSFSKIIKYFRKRKKLIINECSKEQIQINKKGQAAITLVALVVTVVVLIVLAGVSINLVIGNNGIIEKGKIAKESQELAKYKENMSMFIQEKYMESTDFSASTITAYKNKVYYNTKNSDSEETIEEILGNVSSNYIEKLEIIKGELYINTTNEVEKAAAGKAEIKVNGLEISNGELKASDKNLDLKDSDGTLLIPPSVTKIGVGAFSSVENLKKIVVPGTVEEIGANAFSYNSTIEEVIIEDGVKKVGSSAFYGCSSLKIIDFPNSIETLGNSCMSSCTNLEYVQLPSKITVIANSLMNACRNLKEIKIPENVTSIEGYSFSGCTNLERIEIPASVEKIGSGVFGHAKSLKEIVIDKENKNFKFENGLLMSKDGVTVCFGLLSLATIDIPEGVTKILEDGFTNSIATTIKLPNSIQYLNGYEFAGMSKLKTIELKEDNQYFKLDNGNLYTKDGEKLIKYLKKGDTITVLEGVKNLMAYSISSITAKEIKLPSSLETMDWASISSVQGVENIEIPENMKAFDGMAITINAKIHVSDKNENIKSVDDTMVLSKDGKTLYAVSRAATDISIPNTVETIGDKCCYLNTKLTNIELPNSVKNIENKAFGYSNIEKITIPESVQKIENNAFAGCSKLTNITINKKAGSIAGSPWSCPIAERAVKWLK
jgi:surface antigen bspA-like